MDDEAPTVADTLELLPGHHQSSSTGGPAMDEPSLLCLHTITSWQGQRALGIGDLNRDRAPATLHVPLG